jgi:hypothetical protein
LRRRIAVAVVAVAALVAVAAPGVARAADWCGASSPSATDRQPDAVLGLETHLIYAYPSDGQDRLAQLASQIASDFEIIDAWWRAQDPTRTLRLDLYDFPGCATTFGKLDISDVRLPRDSSAYGATASALQDDLDGAFRDPDKKYLVYYDGPVDDPTICGFAPTSVRGGGPDAYAVVRLTSCGGASLGTGGTSAIAVTHELIHDLGALATPFPTPGPPNACPGDQGHPCDNPNDILYPTQTEGDALSSKQLDAGRDDYYGHSGDWWDVQDSPFLDRLTGDLSPPSTPGAPTATGDASGSVVVSWGPSTDDSGQVSYEVYRDGALQETISQTTWRDVQSPGDTHTYAVRALDPAGRLSQTQSLRFTAALGVVDDQGHLVKDTVPPTAIDSLRWHLDKRSLVLRWVAAKDAGGLRGYQVLHAGRVVKTVPGTTYTAAARGARGVWKVRAIDRAGNLGEASSVNVR